MCIEKQRALEYCDYFKIDRQLYTLDNIDYIKDKLKILCEINGDDVEDLFKKNWVINFLLLEHCYN